MLVKQGLMMAAVAAMLFSLPVSGMAQTKAPQGQVAALVNKVEVSTDHQDALYKQGEKITFKGCLLENGKVLEGKKLDYFITGDSKLNSKGSLTSAKNHIHIRKAVAIRS